MLAYYTDNTLLNLLKAILEDLGCSFITVDTTEWPNIKFCFLYQGRTSSVIFHKALSNNSICKLVKEEIETQILLGEI